MDAFAESLAAFGAVTFQVAASLCVALNVGAAAAVVVRRDRHFVNRWTSPWLALNLLLLGVGLGTPLLAGITRLTIRMVTSLGPALQAVVE